MKKTSIESAGASADKNPSEVPNTAIMAGQAKSGQGPQIEEVKQTAKQQKKISDIFASKPKQQEKLTTPVKAAEVVVLAPLLENKDESIDLSSLGSEDNSLSSAKMAQNNKDGGAKKRVTKQQKKKAEKEAKASLANENSTPDEHSVKSQQEQGLDEEMIQNESGALTSSPQEKRGHQTVEEEKNEVAGDGGQIENSGLTKKRGRKPKEQQSPKTILDKPSVEVPEKLREWKDKREQYATILKKLLLNKGEQEERENNIPEKLKTDFNSDADELLVSEEGFHSLEEELIRIGQENEQNQQSDLVINTTSSLISSNTSIMTEQIKLALLKVLGPIIDSSLLNLPKLTQKCRQFLETRLETLKQSPRLLLYSLLPGLSDIICTNAERKSYGIRSKDSILYEDESEDALWYWELFNTTLLPKTYLLNLQYIRSQRSMLGQKIKSLEKLLQLIDKATSVEKDLPRIVEEYDKYMKVIRKENAALQQNLIKEQQQREKERQEKEKLEAKERERMQREQERVAKEQERLQKEQERNLKEQERIKQLKEKEEAKEREREAKERERLTKEEEKERERKQKELEKLQKDQDKIQKEEEKKQKEIEKIEKKKQEEAERAAKIALQEAEKKKEKEEKEAAEKQAKLAQQKNNNPLKNFFKAEPKSKQQALTSSQKDEQNDSEMIVEESNQGQNSSLIRKYPQNFQWKEPKIIRPNVQVTLAQTFKTAFDEKFASYCHHRSAYQGRSDFLKDMVLYRKQLDNFKFPKDRKRCIILDDSMMKYVTFFEKKSFILNPRNPLKKDETIIDYDMDSEEEWNEQNGEDVAADNKMDDAEDDEVEKLLREEEDEEEAAGFIVPDDYLSASEFGLSQSQRSSQVAAELVERRKMLGKRYNHRDKPALNLQHYIFTINQVFPSGISPRSNRSTGMMNYFEEFKAVSFPKERNFPLRLKPLVDPIDEENKASKGINNPNLINTKLVDLVRMMHGSFESKQKIIDDFNQHFPDCSKKSIERKMRDLFEKDKKENDPRQRWYATESTLIELNLQDDPELKSLFNERLQVVLDEINKVKEEQQKLKDEQAKVKEEQRAQIKQQKLEEKEIAQKEKEALKEQAKLQAATATTPHKTQTVETDIEMAADNIDKDDAGQFDIKDAKNTTGEKKASESTKKSEISKKPQNPSTNLTKFFKPMQPEEKQKLLLHELEKVQLEIKSRQQQIPPPAPPQQMVIPHFEVEKDVSKMRQGQQTIQFKQTQSLADQLPPQLLLTNPTSITATKKPQAALAMTATAAKADVQKIANDLNELTAKYVKKEVKPNGINKQPPKKDLEEVKAGGGTAKAPGQKKPRKPKADPKIASQAKKELNHSSLAAKKVRREGSNEVDSDISSDSDKQHALRYHQDMNLVGQPVAGVISVTSDGSLERADFEKHL